MKKPSTTLEAALASCRRRAAAATAPTTYGLRRRHDWLLRMGDVLKELARHGEAAAAYRRALAIGLRLGRRRPASLIGLDLRLRGRFRLYKLARDRDRFRAEDVVYRAAMLDLKDALRRHPRKDLPLNWLSRFVRVRAFRGLERNRAYRSGDLLEKLIGMLREAAAAVPHSLARHFELVDAYEAMTDFCWEDDRRKALPYAERAIQILETLWSINQHPGVRRRLVNHYSSLSSCVFNTEPKRARASIERALRLLLGSRDLKRELDHDPCQLSGLYESLGLHHARFGSPQDSWRAYWKAFNACEALARRVTPPMAGQCTPDKWLADSAISICIDACTALADSGEDSADELIGGFSSRALSFLRRLRERRLVDRREADRLEIHLRLRLGDVP